MPQTSPEEAKRIYGTFNADEKAIFDALTKTGKNGREAVRLVRSMKAQDLALQGSEAEDIAERGGGATPAGALEKAGAVGMGLADAATGGLADEVVGALNVLPGMARGQDAGEAYEEGKSKTAAAEEDPSLMPAFSSGQLAGSLAEGIAGAPEAAASIVKNAPKAARAVGGAVSRVAGRVGPAIREGAEAFGARADAGKPFEAGAAGIQKALSTLVGRGGKVTPDMILEVIKPPKVPVSSAAEEFAGLGPATPDPELSRELGGKIKIEDALKRLKGELSTAEAAPKIAPPMAVADVPGASLEKMKAAVSEPYTPIGTTSSPAQELATAKWRNAGMPESKRTTSAARAAAPFKEVTATQGSPQEAFSAAVDAFRGEPDLIVRDQIAGQLKAAGWPQQLVDMAKSMAGHGIG